MGIPTEDVYHTPVTASYGSDQIIEVLARKELDLTLYYSVNGGDVQEADFEGWLNAHVTPASVGL